MRLGGWTKGTWNLQMINTLVQCSLTDLQTQCTLRI
jgi:hypothetical protein